MFSWSVPSRLAAVTYLEDTASVLGIQIYQLKIATQLTWIITERWAVDYGSNALNHSRLQSLCSVFGGVGPRPQFWAVEKSLGLLLSPNCLPIKRPCNFSLRRSQWPIIGEKIFSSGIKEELGESLPRTQTSLSRRTFARKGRREGELLSMFPCPSSSVTHVSHSPLYGKRSTWGGGWGSPFSFGWVDAW